MITIIKNVNILTMDNKYTQYEDGYICFKDDKITDIGKSKELSPNIEGKVIDGKGAILMPGMINCHTHVGMIPFRSLKEDVDDRLRRFFFPLERNLSKELVYNSGKYAMAEMVLGGVTSFVDMYYFEDEIAKACDEMKMRGILGESVVDFPVCDSDEPFGGLEYGEKFIKKWKDHDLIIPAIAPHAPYTNTRESLTTARDMANEFDILLLIHLAEMEFEIKKYKDEYNMTPIEYLDSIDFLNDRIIGGHLIYLTDNDIDILYERGVKAAHCIGANTKSAKGVARVYDMLNKGIKLGLGTDGPSSGNTIDIITQLKIFGYFHKTYLNDNKLFKSHEILRLATMGGAEVLGLDNIIGSLEIGKKADFIMIETDSVNMFPVFNPYSVVVYSANPSNIRDVFINGEQIVENKKLKQFKLEDIRNDLDKSMEDFRNEANELSKKVN